MRIPLMSDALRLRFISSFKRCFVTGNGRLPDAMLGCAVRKCWNSSIRDLGTAMGSGGLAGFEQGYHVLAGVRAGASPLLMTSQYSTLDGRNGGFLSTIALENALCSFLVEKCIPSVFLSPYAVHLAHGIAKKVVVANLVVEHC